MTDGPRVAILLATLNGERFLDPQIESLAAQTVPHLDVWASDDGSGDTTRERLGAWARRWRKGRFTVLDGPRAGYARNFVSLLQNEAIEADYFAFCDQDDIWDPDKLARAIAWFESAPAGHGPRAYGSRTRIVSSDGRSLGKSLLFPHRPGFRNALVQSIAGGNTIVLDRAARALLARSTRRAEIVSHDWWSYIMVTGAGGRFHYDPRPSLSYRQHDNNTIGASHGWRARIGRVQRMSDGALRKRNELNAAGLAANADLLCDEAKAVIETFRRARTASLPGRLAQLARSGIFRQTRIGNVGLYGACVLGWL